MMYMTFGVRQLSSGILTKSFRAMSFVSMTTYNFFCQNLYMQVIAHFPLSKIQI